MEGPLQSAHGADHLRQTTGVEQLAIEVMRGTMIAQVEPHYLEALLEKLLGKRQDIQRVGAAFPPMHQQDGPARAVLGARMKALQADAVAAIEQHLARRAGCAIGICSRCSPARPRGGRKSISG